MKLVTKHALHSVGTDSGVNGRNTQNAVFFWFWKPHRNLWDSWANLGPKYTEWSNLICANRMGNSFYHAWSEWKSDHHMFETNNIAIHPFISEWNKSWNSYLLCCVILKNSRAEIRKYLISAFSKWNIFIWPNWSLPLNKQVMCLWWSTIHLIGKESLTKKH